MIKIKMFWGSMGSGLYNLEQDINTWIDTNNSYALKNIQTTTAGRDSDDIVVTITYTT